MLSLLPIDGFEPDPVATMQLVGAPAAIPEIVAEAAPIFTAEGCGTARVGRFEFYRCAKAAFAILHTAETRLYGNFTIRKGVIKGSAQLLGAANGSRPAAKLCRSE